MKLLVQIEYCMNCYQHAWCSQHDQEKYLYYFEQVKELLAKKVEAEDEIFVQPKQVPSHFIKMSKNVKDNKYFDAQKQEEVYCPRLGAFEIYVDKILIYSKIKTNKWPKLQTQVANILEMLDHKKKGSDLTIFDFRTTTEANEKEKFYKTFKKKHGITPKKERQLPQISFHDNNEEGGNKLQISPHMTETHPVSHQLKPDKYENSPYMNPKSMNLPSKKEERLIPNSIKNYHQIYSSALNDLRRQNKRQRQEAKEKSRSRDKYRRATYENKRRHRYDEQEIEQFVEYPPVNEPKKVDSSSKKKYKKQTLLSSPTKQRSNKPLDKLIEQELNISEIATPHELDEAEKKKLYKKYNIEADEPTSKGVNERKLIAEKRKYETLLDALKHEEKNYVEKLDVLNKKLGVPPKKMSRTIEPRRISNKDSDSSKRKEDDISFPPIKSDLDIPQEEIPTKQKSAKQTQRLAPQVHQKRNSNQKEFVDYKKYDSKKTNSQHQAKMNNFLNSGQNTDRKEQKDQVKNVETKRIERKKLSLKKVVEMSIQAQFAPVEIKYKEKKQKSEAQEEKQIPEISQTPQKSEGKRNSSGIRIKSRAATEQQEVNNKSESKKQQKESRQVGKISSKSSSSQKISPEKQEIAHIQMIQGQRVGSRTSLDTEKKVRTEKQRSVKADFNQDKRLSTQPNNSKLLFKKEKEAPENNAKTVSKQSEKRIEKSESKQKHEAKQSQHDNKIKTESKPEDENYEQNYKAEGNHTSNVESRPKTSAVYPEHHEISIEKRGNIVENSNNDVRTEYKAKGEPLNKIASQPKIGPVASLKGNSQAQKSQNISDKKSSEKVVEKDPSEQKSASVKQSSKINTESKPIEEVPDETKNVEEQIKVETNQPEEKQQKVKSQKVKTQTVEVQESIDVTPVSIQNIKAEPQQQIEEQVPKEDKPEEKVKTQEKDVQEQIEEEKKEEPIVEPAPVVIIEVEKQTVYFQEKRVKTQTQVVEEAPKRQQSVKQEVEQKQKEELPHQIEEKVKTEPKEPQENMKEENTPEKVLKSQPKEKQQEPLKGQKDQEGQQQAKIEQNVKINDEDYLEQMMIEERQKEKNKQMTQRNTIQISESKADEQNTSRLQTPQETHKKTKTEPFLINEQNIEEKNEIVPEQKVQDKEVFVFEQRIQSLPQPIEEPEEKLNNDLDKQGEKVKTETKQVEEDPKDDIKQDSQNVHIVSSPTLEVQEKVQTEQKPLQEPEQRKEESEQKEEDKIEKTDSNVNIVVVEQRTEIVEQKKVQQILAEKPPEESNIVEEKKEENIGEIQIDSKIKRQNEEKLPEDKKDEEKTPEQNKQEPKEETPESEKNVVVVTDQPELVTTHKEEEKVIEQSDDKKQQKAEESPKKKSIFMARRPPGLIGRLSQKKQKSQNQSKLDQSKDLEKVGKIYSPTKSPKGENSQPINLTLHVNKKHEENPFLPLFEIDKNKITKKHGDGLWHSLKAEQNIPFRGKFSLKFQILKSSMNCIEVGIMPENFQPVENKICNRSIGFHFANGRIHDTNGDKQKKTTQWRLARVASQPGTVGVIEMLVDVDQQIIKWLFEGEQFAFSTLNNYLKQQNCVPYVSMIHAGDSVIISPRNAMERSRSRSRSPEGKNITNQPDSKISAKTSEKGQVPQRDSILERDQSRKPPVNEMNISLTKSQMGNSSLNQSQSPSNIRVTAREHPNATQFERINLTINKDKNINPFIDLYELKHDKITKIGGNLTWNTIKTEVLPRAGKYSFAFSVESSPQNCIEIGIMPEEHIPVQNKVYQKSIGFHYANGKIHDSKGSKEKRGTIWRAVRQPIEVGELRTIEVSVDADSQMMYWRLDGQVFAKSVLTNYLKNLPCVAYVSCFSVGDSLKIKNENKRKYSEVSFSGEKTGNIFEIEPKEEHFDKININVSEDKVLSPFRSQYDVSNRIITKKEGNEVWHVLKGQEVLPKSGKYKFGVNILKSKMNLIEVGFMPKQYIPIEDKICQKSLGFNYATGKVHDTNGNKQKKGVKWRQISKPSSPGEVGTIEVGINVEEQTVFWYLNGNLLGQSVLTNYLKGVVCVPYVSTVHVEDQIQFIHYETKKVEKEVETPNMRKSIIERNQRRGGGQVNEIDIPIAKSQIGHSPRSPSPSPRPMQSIQKEKVSSEEFPQYNFSIEKDEKVNIFSDFYDIKADNPKYDTVTKIGGNGLWHILKGHETLPSSGKYSFETKIIKSELNCIEVGIMPQDFTPIEHKICERSIGFHYANGKVHDTNGNKEKRGTKWRKICEPIPAGKVGTIEVDVNVDDQTIYWKLDGQILDKSTLTNYLKQRTCVAYISMVTVNDIVETQKYESKISSRIAEKKVENSNVRESMIERKTENEIDIPITKSQIGHPLTKSQSPQHIKVNKKDEDPLDNFNKLSFSVSNNKEINPFVDLYAFNRNTIKKIGGNNLWHILKTDKTLPSTGKYQFSMEILKSEANVIELGIMPEEYVPIQNRICQKSLGFHYANGKVHDTKGKKDKKGTSWRAVRETAAKGQLGTIGISVDTDIQMVYWRLDGKIFAKSVLTDYLKSVPCVAYISMFHQNDSVLLEGLQKTETIDKVIEQKPEITEEGARSPVFYTGKTDQIRQKQERVEQKGQEKPPIDEKTPTQVKPEQKVQTLQKVKQTPLKEYPLTQVSISLDPNFNPFINLYKIKEDLITKTDKDEIWHIIRSKQTLPKEGKYSLSFKILESKLNCIQVGIIPGDYVIVQNKICVKSIGFLVANGKIHDTDGKKEKGSTKWREVCAPVPPGALGTVEMEIDNEAQMIYWKFSGNIFAESVLTNYLKGKQLHAYVSMIHVNDVVQLNQSVEQKLQLPEEEKKEEQA